MKIKKQIDGKILEVANPTSFYIKVGYDGKFRIYVDNDKLCGCYSSEQHAKNALSYILVHQESNYIITMMKDEENKRLEMEYTEKYTPYSGYTRDCIDMYIDGSYKDGYCGYAVCIFRNGMHLENIVGNYQDIHGLGNVSAELTAAKEGVLYAIRNGYSEINIYYDYAGIKDFLGREVHEKEEVNNYILFMKEKLEEINIQFIKIKGHSRIVYHNLADELAKKAINDIKKE